MSANNILGTILIRENTLLPTSLALQGEAFLPGWRIVRDIDVHGLGRKIDEAHWNFFYLAGEIKAIVFGHEQPGALCKAVKQILAKQEGQKCNSLEITSVTSKSFLGIPFLSVTANSRHIQESLYLVPVAGLAPGATAAAVPGTKFDGSERPPHGEVLTRQDPALV